MDERQTVHLSSRGRIVIPSRIRKARKWNPGTEFMVEDTGDGVLLRPVRPFPRTTLDMVVGCLRYKGKPKTLAQMEAGIARAIQERHERSRA